MDAELVELPPLPDEVEQIEAEVEALLKAATSSEAIAAPKQAPKPIEHDEPDASPEAAQAFVDDLRGCFFDEETLTCWEGLEDPRDETAHEWLVRICDTSDDDETIVARHYAALAALTEIDDPKRLRRFLGFVRKPLLERHAYETNHAEADFGGDTKWIVCRGQVVDEGGFLHRELLRGEQRRPLRRQLVGIVRPLIRLRDRGRARRDHGATSRRASSRSRDRREADPPPRPREVAA